LGLGCPCDSFSAWRWTEWKRSEIKAFTFTHLTQLLEKIPQWNEITLYSVEEKTSSVWWHEEVSTDWQAHSVVASARQKGHEIIAIWLQKWSLWIKYYYLFMFDFHPCLVLFSKNKICFFLYKLIFYFFELFWCNEILKLNKIIIFIFFK
jgi:hypothetical protein